MAIFMSDKRGQVFVVNAGSSSIKATLFAINKPLSRMIDVRLKNIGHDKPVLEICTHSDKKSVASKSKLSLKDSFQVIFENIEKKISKLEAIGHRFVHGGDIYQSKVAITDEVRKNLKSLLELAPLHNPYCLEGINAAFEFFGQDICQWAVFDTAFHKNMPKIASSYAISDELAKKCNIKRFGFHGISHGFLWKRYKNFSKDENAKIITLHLGNGCSMAAINGGISVETSMGLTPAEGLVMGTRAGDIDAAAVEIIGNGIKASPEDVMSILNKESGLLGLSDMSSDMAKIIQELPKNAKAAFALELFCYRVVKYIGSYMFVLNGANALVFSGGIGENAPLVRKKILEGIKWYGCLIDQSENEKAVNLDSGEIACITKKESKLAVYVIATDENLAIAEDIEA